MTQTMFSLLAEPVGELYYDLLDFALTQCRVALLVQRRQELADAGQEVLRQLAGFLRSATQADEWPGTKTSGWTATVLRYSYVPACAAVLKRATDRLYGWAQPALPEDLCLLRNDDDPWLVTISDETDGYLCLSPSEKGRLVKALPRFGHLLADERSRARNQGVLVEVQRLLDAWDPEGDGHYRYPPGGYGPEAQAIHYALSSGEAGTEVELARYIAAMLERWWSRYSVIPSEACAELARTVWAWWQKRQRHTDQG
jgi:hypothetical protein